MNKCSCGEEVPQKRWELGYHCCLDCGETRAVADRQSWTIAPLHKSSYMLITDPLLLKQLNKVSSL